MYRLEQREYRRLRPIFEGLRYNLVIDSVIDGNTPAWMYVDDVRHPRMAWIWNRQDAILLAGYAGDEALNRALAELIGGKVVSDARRRHIPQLSLHYFPEAWESKIDMILRDRHPEKAQRRFYTFDQLQVDWRKQIPAGCEMRRIDEALLESTHLEHICAVVGWVRSFWASSREFAKTGFGFCLLQGDTIVSLCLSVYVSGRHFELGLATAPDYRGQGFATLVAAACVEHCVKNDFTPHWHCWEENLPSVAVAEKVGFESPTPYWVYRFQL